MNSLQGVTVGDTAGDDTQSGAIFERYMIIRQLVDSLLYLFHPLHDKPAVVPEIGRQADQPEGVFDEFPFSLIPGYSTKDNVAAGMADAGHRAQHEHLAELLGKSEGIGHHVLGFLGGGGLQHGYVSLPGDIAVVLLILGAPLAGVVGGNQHQSAKSHIAGGHQGVVGHIHAHVLHNG